VRVLVGRRWEDELRSPTDGADKEVHMAKRAKLRLNANLESQLEAMLAPKMEAFQEEFNQVLSDRRGGSVEEIHQALIDVTAKHGFEPNVDELRKKAAEYAG
jgi:hypothetical protein